MNKKQSEKLGLGDYVAIVGLLILVLVGFVNVMSWSFSVIDRYVVTESEAHEIRQEAIEEAIDEVNRKAEYQEKMRNAVKTYVQCPQGMKDNGWVVGDNTGVYKYCVHEKS